MNNLSKLQKRIFIAAIIIVVGIVGYYVYGRNTSSETVTEDEMLVKNETNTAR